MSTDLKQGVMKALRDLEEILDIRGWDEPSALYIIESVDGDPYLVKVLDFDDHPCDILDVLPPLTAPRARGIVLAYEGWNVQVDGDLVQRSYQLLEDMDVPQALRDEIVSIAIANLAPPPDERNRVECRIVQAVMRDGSSFSLMRQRGGEVSEDTNGQAMGRLDTSLRRVICVEARND